MLPRLSDESRTIKVQLKAKGIEVLEYRPKIFQNVCGFFSFFIIHYYCSFENWQKLCGILFSQYLLFSLEQL